MFLDFKKWVKSIQTAGYNGARTVYCNVVLAAVAFSAHQKKMLIWLERHFKGLENFKCRVPT